MTRPGCERCEGAGWVRTGFAAYRCPACNPAPSSRTVELPHSGGARPRRKGIRGELELAAWLRERGISARRGAQRRGGPDSPDVVTSLPFHVECKRMERLALWRALAQAQADAGERPAVVLHRTNRHPWVAILAAEDLLFLLGLGPSAPALAEAAAAELAPPAAADLSSPCPEPSPEREELSP